MAAALRPSPGVVVRTTFAWRHAVAAVDPRWFPFGMGVTGASIGLVTLFGHTVTAYEKEINGVRAAAITTVGAAGALAVTIAVRSSMDYRWIAFGLGARWPASRSQPVSSTN